MRKIHNKIIYKGISKGLSYTGNGHGYNKKLVSKQNYSFFTNKLMSEKQAKQLLSDLTSYAVKIYNSDPSIAPAYLEYPISSDSLFIAIHFLDEEGKYRISPHMCSIMKVEDSFLFSYKDTPETSIFDERKETEPFPRITFEEEI